MSTTKTDKNEFGDETSAPEGTVWKRGLHMLIFAVLFELARTVLLVVTLVQFFWMLFAKEKNAGLVDFGVSLGKWLRHVSEFQTGSTDEKPFPWGKWEQ